MAPYTISINNKSGRKQSYAIFAGAPTIKHNGGSAVQITTRIISSVRAVAADQGQATFMLSKSWYATCGIYDIDYDVARGDENRGKATSGTEVVDQREVQLSYVDEGKGGQLVPGTFLEIDCADGTPSFARTFSPPNLDPIEGCFGIRTVGDFIGKEAEANKFVIGFTSSLRPSIGPYATFVPEPSQVYHVAPSSKMYVCVGNFTSRDLIKANIITEQSTFCVDFGPQALATDRVTLTHNSRGKLNIDASNDSVVGTNGFANARLFRIPAAMETSVTVSTAPTVSVMENDTPQTSDNETDY